MSAHIAFAFIWKVSIHSRSLEMTSDGEVPLHGYAVNCEVAPSKTVGIRRFCFLFLSIRGPKSPNSLALNPRTRDLSGLGFVELQNGHVFTTCW